MAVEAVLLGTAQDGGVPHAGCDCPVCSRAWEDPDRRKLVASLGIIDRESGKAWLIDATPHFPEQLHMLASLAPECELAGIILTHAHIGHYAGLIHLGKEVLNVKGVALYASQRMLHFLQENAPWADLVANGNLQPRVIKPHYKVRLGEKLLLVGYQVPHRDEHSDTLAFLLEGLTQRLFYCPDIDSWERWDHRLREFLSGTDVALLDGTFFTARELGENFAKVPHPPVVQTTELLAETECAVYFIHLNHTNPLFLAGPERRWLLSRGFRVGQRGNHWRLS